MTQREYDDPIDALKAELAAVSPSPDFQARVRQRIAGELDLLRQELATVAPSPEFTVRVRQGIAEAEAARAERAGSWLSGWRWIVPVGAVAAGVVAAVLLSRPQSPAPEQVTAKAPEVREVPGPSVGSETPAVAPSATSNVERRTANVRRSVPAVSVVPRTADPVLEVITNQPALLREMWLRAEQAAAFADAIAEPELVGQRDVEVTLIEVQPVVVKWLVEPPVPSGVLPFIRRMTAEMAERSDK